jgi:hypothetical protein
MLAKFPDCRLHITIREDSGLPVRDHSESIIWSDGKLYDPAELVRQPPVNPPGLILSSVASLPSALRDALLRRMQDPSLKCLGPVRLPAGGLWIGFDVVLRPCSGYTVAVEVVTLKSDGTLVSADDEPYLSWKFRTSLYATASALVKGMAGSGLRHRMLIQPLVLDPPAAGQHVNFVADKMLEEALTTAMGERPALPSAGQLTVLWQKISGPQFGVARAVAILLAHKEPMFRRTRTVRLEELTADPPAPMRVVSPTEQLLFGPDKTKSDSIERFTISTGGFTIVAHLNATTGSPAGATIAFTRQVVDRIESGFFGTESSVLDATLLADRPL